MIQVQFSHSNNHFTTQIDTEFPSSGVTAIFGPSGSGKTTLLRAISGLDRYRNARVCINHKVWQDGDIFLPVYQRNLSFVFQEGNLFNNLDVKGNLDYANRRAIGNHTEIDMDSVIQHFGIEKLLTRQPVTLSGGEVQRVAMARAVLRKPMLILMDEPLASLDETAKTSIMPFIEYLCVQSQVPIVYVSHSLVEVSRLANYVLMMEQGHIRCQGNCEDMLTRLDLPLANSQDSMSIISASVRGHDRPYQLTLLDFNGHTLFVPKIEAAIGQSVRLRFAARDISLCLSKPADSSILNFIPAIVDSYSMSESHALVRLLVDNIPLLARVTRKSVEELNIVRGKSLYAQIKSMAIN